MQPTQLVTPWRVTALGPRDLGLRRRHAQRHALRALADPGGGAPGAVLPVVRYAGRVQP